MPTETVTVHPSSLSLAASALAWYLWDKQQWKWKDIRAEVRNVQRKVPSFKAVRHAVERVRSSGKRGLPETAYANCSKRFCTCQYIAQEIKLDVTPQTKG